MNSRFTLLLLFLFISAHAFELPIFGKIAVVRIHGEIGSDVKARDVVKVLKEIDSSHEYVGVILDINSGGGSAVQSHEIVKALDRMKKPKVAFIEDVGASGAYWIASACDYIISDELSIVGSIGAASMFYSPEELAEKLGIKVYQVAYPENKSFGLPVFNATLLPYARSMVRSAGEFFIEDISRRRPGARKYLTGLPYLAKDAPELVDSFGTFEDAVEKVRELSNSKYAEPEYIEVESGFRALLKELGVSSKLVSIFRIIF